MPTSEQLSNSDDLFQTTSADDYIDGGVGIDAVMYSGKRDEYIITKSSNALTITDTLKQDGIDTVVNIERLYFSDKAVGFDSNDNVGSAYRIYKAAFDRTPDLNGLGYWIDQMDQGASLQTVAAGFLNSAEFTAMYGTNPSSSNFVATVYNHVLHRAYDPSGFNFWVNSLNTGANTQASLLAQFSESPENQNAVYSTIANGVEFTPPWFL